mmetsp:Transcript_9801/g.41150  ORF Transcript_9801/g.41150 Transcript_9801/m.41150 type:complete len:240 (+) Transcript_9801:1113-1832(+)
MCAVICAFVATLMNRWSTISVLRSPMVSSRNTSPLHRYGRLDRSAITSTRASPTRAVARPMRLHPALLPSASFSTCPTVMATSSVVWWSSIHRSPLASTFSWNDASSAIAKSKASRVRMPVATVVADAAPSKSTATSMVVSFVARALRDARCSAFGASVTSRSVALVDFTSASIWSINALVHRANALNVASTMWCALSPRRFKRVTSRFACVASADQNGSVRAVLYVPMRARPFEPSGP